MEQKIAIEERDNLVLITMNSGGGPNTIDIALCDGLLASLNGLAAHPSCRAVILRASGSTFSAGGDLRRIFDEIHNPDGYLERLINRFHELILFIRRLPIPVIACVQGAAAGAGFSLVMACDVVVASSAAKFVVGYPRLGTSSDGGLSLQLARRLGFGRAFELCLISGSLDAVRAQELGLVQHVFEPMVLDAETVAMTRRLTLLPYAAIAELKSLMNSATDNGFERHLELEREAFLRCASTNDFRQRVTDFVKRTV